MSAILKFCKLLLAKLHACGLSRSALLTIHSYLSQRRQRVKINGSFSTWKEVQKGAPQGFVLCPLLLNIFLNDLFLLVDRAEICHYADDSAVENIIDTSAKCHSDINLVS